MVKTADLSYEEKAEMEFDTLNRAFGTTELEASEKVLLMDGWNTILGWETIWKEAMWFRWRILVARKDLIERTKRMVMTSAIRHRRP